MLAISKYDPLEDIPASTGELWYAFYSHIRAEKRAGEEIEAIDKVLVDGKWIPRFKTFVPIEKPRHKPPRALFNRYGFVRFDINHGGWGEIIERKSVVDLVRMNGIPSAVPDVAVSTLQLLDEIGHWDHTKPPKVGTSVEVMPGWPFAGEIGEIKDVPRRKRARVFFAKFMRVMWVPLDALREA